MFLIELGPWHFEHSLYPSDAGSTSSDSGMLVKILTGEPFFPAPPPDLKARWLTYSTWAEIWDMGFLESNLCTVTGLSIKFFDFVVVVQLIYRQTRAEIS